MSALQDMLKHDPHGSFYGTLLSSQPLSDKTIQSDPFQADKVQTSAMSKLLNNNWTDKHFTQTKKSQTYFMIQLKLHYISRMTQRKLTA